MLVFDKNIHSNEDNMKQIFKFVITGGPCGGKTSAHSYLKDELSKYGYKVVVMSETASEVMNSGLTYSAYNADNIAFEKNIVALQLAKESIYDEACKKLPNDKIILICDRGIMDCKSYMTKPEWHKLCIDLGISENQLINNYDAVFHLVTAAKGAEKFYTTQNNTARKENNIEDAIIADERTLAIWKNHPHHKIIDNSTNFEQKMQRLINEILCFIEERNFQNNQKEG